MERESEFRPALERAIKIMGTQRALAEACGITQGSIWHTLRRKQKMPAWLAVRIVDATKGQVSIKDLLPEVYARVEPAGAYQAPAA